MALYTIYPAHPDWKSANMEMFDDCYEQVIGIRYPLRDPKPKLIAIRSIESKRCALCGNSDLKKFSHTAHLLPAALGNRHYASDEECDKCNDDFGKAYENALANMLAVERAFYRVRSRKGTAKLQPKGTAKHHSDDGGNSFIGGGRYDEGLRIQIHKSDSSVRTKDGDNNTFIVSARNPSYNPTFALKSILKSFWLSVNDSTRIKYDYIRRYLTNDPSFEQKKSELFKYFLSDAPDVVVFEAWSKKDGITTQTSDLVIRLSMAHTSLIWCSPNSTTFLHAPSLLPPVLQNQVVTVIQATKILCPPDKLLIKAHDISFSIAYNSRVRTVGGEPNSASQQEEPISPSSQSVKADENIEEEDDDRSAIAVSLEASVGDVCQIIDDTKIVIYRLDKQFMIFRIVGGQFAANLLMQVDLETNSVSFREDYKFHLYPAHIAVNTIDLLLLAYRPGVQLKVTTKDTNKSAFFIPFFRGQNVPASLRLYQEMFAHLRMINSSLGKDFRIGRQLSQPDLQAARRLVRVISQGNEECDKLKVHFNSNSEKKHLTTRQPECFTTFVNEQIELDPLE